MPRGLALATPVEWCVSARTMPGFRHHLMDVLPRGCSFWRLRPQYSTEMGIEACIGQLGTAACAKGYGTFLRAYDRLPRSQVHVLRIAAVLVAITCRRRYRVHHSCGDSAV